ncbi:MAG: DUF5063 domain-containing protein [Bacteroidales bacterium]|nr:DUF5063 domain-containing protein [Bacteroidales bacterium]
MNKRIFNKNVIEFITVAKEYVLFCENIEKVNTEIILNDLLKLLPLLYLKGAMLPEFSYDDYFENIVSEDVYNTIKERFQQKFGEYDISVPVNTNLFNFEETEIEPISELLADIYQDMKNVIFNFQTNINEIMESALCRCKQNFENYWGPRLISALNILHLLRFNENIDLKDIKQVKRTENKIDTSKWIINKFFKNSNG